LNQKYLQKKKNSKENPKVKVRDKVPTKKKSKVRIQSEATYEKEKKNPILKLKRSDL